MGDVGQRRAPRRTLGASRRFNSSCEMFPLPALAANTRLPIRKAMLFEMLMQSLSIADRFH